MKKLGILRYSGQIITIFSICQELLAGSQKFVFFETAKISFGHVKWLFDFKTEQWYRNRLATRSWRENCHPMEHILIEWQHFEMNDPLALVSHVLVLRISLSLSDYDPSKISLSGKFGLRSIPTTASLCPNDQISEHSRVLLWIGTIPDGQFQKKTDLAKTSWKGSLSLLSLWRIIFQKLFFIVKDVPHRVPNHKNSRHL